MAVEVINEYLEAAANCLKSRKSGGGCFGYAGTLLLFCVIDALGVYLSNDKVKIDGNDQKIKNEPFRVLNHGIFGLNLTAVQIKLLEKSYRNTLAHNAIIGSGAFLVQMPGSPAPQFPFTFATDRVQVINVDSFYQLVDNAWKQFPKSRIRTWVAQRPKP